MKKISTLFILFTSINFANSQTISPLEANEYCPRSL